MKLVTFTKKDGGERIGALIGGESQVLDLRAAGELSGAADNPALASMLAFIEAGGQAVLMANPEVLHASIELRDHEEASPCLPGVSAKVTRPRAVTVRFLNADGEVEERDFVGLWATSVQHQIDHLNGRMYFDRLSKMKRDMLLRKARKRA